MAGLLDGRRLRRRLGVLVENNGIVKVVIVELILENIVLRRSVLLGLGELDCPLLELLQSRVVQVVKAVVRELIHGRQFPRPVSKSLPSRCVGRKYGGGCGQAKDATRILREY